MRGDVAAKVTSFSPKLTMSARNTERSYISKFVGTIVRFIDHASL